MGLGTPIAVSVPLETLAAGLPFSGLGAPISAHAIAALAILPLEAVAAVRPVALLEMAAVASVAVPVPVVLLLIMPVRLVELLALRPVLETLLRVEGAWLGLLAPSLRLTVRSELAAILVVERFAARYVAGIARRAMATHAAWAAIGELAASLLHLLLTVGEDDAVIVLGVLQIVLGQDRIARRVSVPGHRHVLLGHVRGRAPDLDVRAIALEAAGQGVLTLAAWIVAIVVSAATSAVLLSLPHGLRSQLFDEIMPWRSLARPPPAPGP
jgi:hypothetical protein